MTDLHIERDFPVTPEVLFKWITDPEKLLKWWGPEGVHVPEHNLDFSRKGAWYSVMENKDGDQFKVSGHVTHIDAPVSVGFTWAWHDDTDARGPESHVMLRVSEGVSGARLTLDHRDLADETAAERHEEGWSSTFRKLSAALD